MNDFHALNQVVAAIRLLTLACCFGAAAANLTHAQDKTLAKSDAKKMTVTFTGGHETDPQDKGRPVVLIASALGVKSEVFREAFSGVRPARDHAPTGDEQRRNKEVLMKVLQPHGITNERLDEVSNYYRYKPGKGNLWKTTSARAYALVEDGKVKQIVVTDSGSGYSSEPTASVEGLGNVKLKVEIQFTKEFKTNGGVTSIKAE
jgi:hypothetical protein